MASISIGGVSREIFSEEITLNPMRHRDVTIRLEAMVAA
jgi:hypothetical protein